MDYERANRIAQWVFDTRSILGRFHLWLEDVEEEWTVEPGGDDASFVGAALQRALIVSAGVTALGTRLFGHYGEGRETDPLTLNRVKKTADGVAAYSLSEALWYLTRNLPENHAVMVSLGEGLMAKVGEAPDLGSNPLLGFGRVYARPQVAKSLDRKVHRLINDPVYDWDCFWSDLERSQLTVWGAAIDTLEGTSRFAKGNATGPMVVLHLYDQPLKVSAPYEGYVGNLVLPREVVEAAEERSILLSYHTPRKRVHDTIRAVYPDIPSERIHVWTLGGASRESRLGSLWEEWRAVGAHLVEDGWRLPGKGEAFVDSGTYAPVAQVGTFDDEQGQRHLFLCDGYAASAEAIQGGSLDPIFDTHTSLSLFSSTFKLPWRAESDVMRLAADSPDFARDFARISGRDVESELVETYRSSIREALAAGMPCGRRSLTIDDFFPRKKWRVLAVNGFMLPDPYTGSPGVEKVDDGVYRVSVRSATRHLLGEVTLTLRLGEPFEESRLVFSPLLDRFCAGEDFRNRPVKVSDSGRIRNELQTLAADALENLEGDRIRVHFDRIRDAAMSREKRESIRGVLRWYKENHPTWFRWLELAD